MNPLVGSQTHHTFFIAISVFFSKAQRGQRKFCPALLYSDVRAGQARKLAILRKVITEQWDILEQTELLMLIGVSSSHLIFLSFLLYDYGSFPLLFAYKLCAFKLTLPKMVGLWLPMADEKTVVVSLHILSPFDSYGDYKL